MQALLREEIFRMLEATALDKVLQREAGLSGPGVVSGLLQIDAKPGTPGSAPWLVDQFADINVILYLSSWVVSGKINSALPADGTFYLKLEDENKILRMGIGNKQWEIEYPSNKISISNDVQASRLTINFLREAFCSNDLSWFVRGGSLLHIKVN